MPSTLPPRRPRPSPPAPLRRLLGAALVLVLGLPPASAQAPAPAHARQDARCPPVARAPTQQDIEAGIRRARDHGLLWKLQRDGRTSWLYGTLHVGRLEWLFPGPALTQALRSSRSVALELDISDPALMQQLMRLPPGIAMPSVPPPLRKRLDAQAAAACVDAGALARLHPVLEATSYTLFAARREHLDPVWGLEGMLAGYARGAGLPITSLETPQSQLLALLPREPAEALAMVSSILDQLESGRASALMARLAAAWERGDLDELARYEQWCECVRNDTERAAMRVLLDERNPALADGIAAMHARGEVFAAVGALHMVGATGLPQLLQARGFSVERVAFGPGPAAAAAVPESASAP